MKLISSVMMVCAVCSVPAFAQDRSDIASISSAHGSVLINQGSQFVPAGVGDHLASGDRLMVPRDGAAEIVFSDGCKYSVKPGTMITVPSVSTCAGGVISPINTEPAGAGAIGLAGGGASSGPPIAAFVIAGATAGYVLVHNASSNNNPRPISP
ncbi:MAG TPA: hypothetical protein VFB32_04005 [Rudaea sp.]|nr:hypothetical protein [Rudaea sp.]